jgi:NADP-dependent aldehyde dehydrogenase
MPASVTSIDPRTGAVLAELGPQTSASELDAAVRAAADSADALEDTGLPGRIAALRAVAEAIAADPDLVALADRETALGADRLTGELARTAGQFRLFADVLEDGSLLGITIDRRRPPGQAGGPRPDLRRTSVPLGPVAVYGASNFPLAFGAAGTDTASALAAGCPVVVKAHPLHPQTSEAAVAAVRRALVAAGLPDEAVQLVHGMEVGGQLIGHRLIRAGAFTGSVTGGRALFDLAVGRPDPIPFYGELGSLNPLVVTPGAAAGRGAELGEGLAASILNGQGQFCTKPGLILLPAGAPGDAVRAALVAAVEAKDAGVLLGARIAEGYQATSDRLAAVDGMRLVAAGAGPTATGGAQAVARLWEIGAGDALAAADVVFEECFGPSAVLVTYTAPDEAVTLLERLEGSLTVTVLAEPDEAELSARLLRVARRRAGRVLGAGVPTGVAVTWATQHGGPWPATTSPLTTSVGAAAITRFLRPVTYQDVDPRLLPPELADDNPWGLVRRVDGVLTRSAIGAGGAPAPS